MGKHDFRCWRSRTWPAIAVAGVVAAGCEPQPKQSFRCEVEVSRVNGVVKTIAVRLPRENYDSPVYLHNPAEADAMVAALGHAVDDIKAAASQMQPAEKPAASITLNDPY